MTEIVKSIVLGVLTITVWCIGAVFMNDKNNNSMPKDKGPKEQITFVETLTIDYEGDTIKI